MKIHEIIGAAGHKMFGDEMLGEQRSVKRHYVGSCKDSFDDDGDCIVRELPWSTVSDMAVADENATPTNKDNFLHAVSILGDVTQRVSGHDLSYSVTEDGVYVLYDDTTDTHYFFV